MYDAASGMLTVTGLDERVLGVEVFDAAGKLVAQHGPSNGSRWQLPLPRVAATYHIALRTELRTLVKRVVAWP